MECFKAATLSTPKKRTKLNSKGVYQLMRKGTLRSACHDPSSCLQRVLNTHLLLTLTRNTPALGSCSVSSILTVSTSAFSLSLEWEAGLYGRQSFRVSTAVRLRVLFSTETALQKKYFHCIWCYFIASCHRRFTNSSLTAGILSISPELKTRRKTFRVQPPGKLRNQPANHDIASRQKLLS